MLKRVHVFNKAAHLYRTRDCQRQISQKHNPNFGKCCNRILSRTEMTKNFFSLNYWV